jgi:hypothetical protein
MRSVAPGLTKLAAVIFFAAAQTCIYSADPQSQLPPSKRNAPKGQKLEFSSSGGAPEVPKPTSRAEELQKKPALAPDSSAAFNAAAGGIAPSGPVQAQPISKELAARMLQELDRRKNWMVPGAQEAGMSGAIGDWANKGFDKKEAIGEEKNESVMERFLKGENSKNKRDEKGKTRETRDNEAAEESEIADNKRAGETDDRKRDANLSGEESNAAVDFSLKGALTPGNRTDDESRRKFVPPPTVLRGDLGQEMNRSLREKSLAREREATRSAEFNDLIKPRSGLSFSGLDPINSAPDLTRREFNPVLPRASEPSRPELGSFSSSFGSGTFGAGSFGGSFGGSAPGAGFSLPDQNMFGVAVPTVPSFAPSATQTVPQPATTFKPASSIILEPPKRIF